MHFSKPELCLRLLRSFDFLAVASFQPSNSTPHRRELAVQVAFQHLKAAMQRSNLGICPQFDLGLVAVRVSVTRPPFRNKKPTIHLRYDSCICSRIRLKCRCTSSPLRTILAFFNQPLFPKYFASHLRTTASKSLEGFLVNQP